MNPLTRLLSLGFRSALALLNGATVWMPGRSKLRQFLATRSTRSWKTTLVQCQAAAETAAENQLQIYWFHVASAGELEQAVPLARSLLAHRPCGFVVTYTSPSAVPFLGNMPGLLVSFPHPLFDALRLLRVQAVLRPRAVFLIRYDFWPSVFSVCRELQTPLYLIGATAQRAASGLRAQLKVFKRKNHFLRQFTHVFAISAADAEKLALSVGNGQVSVAGEPKWVRAKERAREPLPAGGPLAGARAAVACFRALTQKPVVIFGSPHKEEGDVLKMCLEAAEPPYLAVVAPHDTDRHSIEKWTRNLRSWGAHPLKVSELVGATDQPPAPQRISGVRLDGSSDPDLARYEVSHLNRERLLERAQMPPDMGSVPVVLLADGVGYLAQLYGLCDIAVVGGGFDGGLHNCLEPAAQGLATLFGNRFERAPEATVLLENQAARTFATPTELFQFLNQCATVGRPDASRGVCNQERAHLSVHAVRLFESVPDTNLIILQHLDNAEGHMNVLPEGKNRQQTEISHKMK